MTLTGMRLGNKVSIVTGAGSSGPGTGTGKATAILFAREGSKVLLVDRIASRAEETLSIIMNEGGNSSIIFEDSRHLFIGNAEIEYSKMIDFNQFVN